MLYGWFNLGAREGEGGGGGTMPMLVGCLVEQAGVMLIGGI